MRQLLVDLLKLCICGLWMGSLVFVFSNTDSGVGILYIALSFLLMMIWIAVSLVEESLKTDSRRNHSFFE